MVNMAKTVKRGGHESDQHIQLKAAAESDLLSNGFQPTLEANIGNGHRLDVLGLHGGKVPVAIECETLMDLQTKLVSTFRKVQIMYGQVNAVLCIPQFTEIAEIWCVNNVGNITKYKREVTS